MCIRNSRCYNYIVKSEWLNRRSFVTDTAFLPVCTIQFCSKLYTLADSMRGSSMLKLLVAILATALKNQ